MNIERNTMKNVDIAFEKANSSNERPRYFKMKMLNGGTCIKKYKPSVANLFVQC